MKIAGSKPSLAVRFKQRILNGFLVRFQMSLILTAVAASGVTSSKLLLMAGVHSLRLRYPIAVLASYAVFLGLVRMWLWYVSVRRNNAFSSGGNFNLGNFDWGAGGGRTVGAPVEFGGGSSGGGGASDMWGEPVAADIGPIPVGPSGGGSGGWFPSFDFDLDGDGLWILILLAVLILAIVFAGGYLIYAAPEILPEAAWQFALAGVLKRATTQQGGWMPGVMRSSAVPFFVVLILTAVLGWEAHHVCPSAVKLLQVFNCPGKL